MDSAARAAEPAAPAEQPAPPDVVEEDLLVEEVSIDGMCGVY
ncbi:mycofactocin precursor MftA [Actinomadura parmotrematis]|uniref:Mycofactocin MftA n=1 Tax=Actinomadura parmotrematis TaxID=2864039 RepID=A0ABS7FSI0_9ACTN|nr:mycofactocin precursor MftA [Actinomadura parmotrematis]MBW8482694.1 mycofactocin precursor MftA [Actinomadura parmotrematis]